MVLVQFASSFPVITVRTRGCISILAQIVCGKTSELFRERTVRFLGIRVVASGNSGSLQFAHAFGIRLDAVP